MLVVLRQFFGTRRTKKPVLSIIVALFGALATSFSTKPHQIVLLKRGGQASLTLGDGYICSYRADGGGGQFHKLH